MAKKKQSTSSLKAPTYSFGVLLFTLLVGLAIGFYGSLFFLNSDWKPAILYEDDHEHNHEMHEHEHDMYEVGTLDSPTVSIEVTKDAKSGYNLHIETTDFTFSPKNVNRGKTLGQGHAHLYIDGEKITRLYAPDYYLGELSLGMHEISVTLNTDDHFDYTVDGEIVSDEVIITVSE